MNIVSGKYRVCNISAIAATCIFVTACGGGDSTDDAASQTDQRSQALSAQVGAAADSTATWAKAASEGQTFQLLETRSVRFGVGNTWLRTKLSGSVACSAATFGSDPAPGQAKTCEIRSDVIRGIAALSWAANTDPAVTGYRVYYGDASGKYLQSAGGGYSSGKQITYTIAGLPPGKLYYFAVTAVDASGAESTYSNEVSKLVP